MDINKAAKDSDKANKKSASKLVVPQTAPISSSTDGLDGSPFPFGPAATTAPTKRTPLQHQTSLTASATAAVGEARKFLGNKLSQLPVDARGAKDMVLAAASHLGGGVVSAGAAAVQDLSRVKFKNLRSDEVDDDDSDSSSDHDDDDDDEGTTNAAESTTMEDDEEEEDEESSSDFARSASFRTPPKNRTKRSQSLLSSALSSYKQKQRGGYQKALNEEDDEEEDEDDDDDERMNLNRSVSFKEQKSNNNNKKIKRTPTSGKQQDSTKFDLNAPISTPKISGSIRSNAARVTSSSDVTKKVLDDQIGGDESDYIKRGASSRRHSRRASKKKKKKRKSLKSSRKVLAKYEEDDDDLDAESGQRTFRCLDNSVALLLKTRLEETILRCAVGAIILAAIGLFILLSLPPPEPPRDITSLLDVQTTQTAAGSSTTG